MQSKQPHRKPATINAASIQKPVKVKKKGGVAKFFVGLLIGILTPVVALVVFIIISGGNIITFVTGFDINPLTGAILEMSGGSGESTAELDVRVELDISMYEAMEKGMSYKEVTKIIGTKGDVLKKSGSKTEYEWVDVDYDDMTITATFTSGKLSSKSQKGLD